MTSWESSSSSSSSDSDSHVSADDAEGDAVGAHVSFGSPPLVSSSHVLSTTGSLPSSPRAAAQGLLPKERIHRYVDQCIPPALLLHQRDTDGSLLTQICSELEEFGGPGAWTPSTTSDFNERGAPGSHFGVDGYGDLDSLQHPVAASLFSMPLYSCEGVPGEPSSSFPELSFEPPASIRPTSVTWQALTHRLNYLVKRLTYLLSAPRGCLGTYLLPLRLQAVVVPLLYQWVTHWPLIEADVECWKAVVSGFNVACPSRKPARHSRTGASTSVSDSKLAGGYDYLLPWKPLVALLKSTRDERNFLVPAWHAKLTEVVVHLPSLCRRASPHFGPEAVEGLWGLVAPALSPTADGAAAFSDFVRLVPYQHLSKPVSSANSVTAAVEAAEPTSTLALVDGVGTAKASDTTRTNTLSPQRPPPSLSSPLIPRELTGLAKRVLHFLLVEAATWCPPTPLPPRAVLDARKHGNATHKRRRSPWQRLFLPWERGVSTFVSSLVRAHPGTTGMDAFAEPLFTSWLLALRLPLEGDTGLRPGSSVKSGSQTGQGSSMRSTRAHPDTKNAGSGCDGAQQLDNSKGASFVGLLNFFSADTTDTPLWRHFERWLHATSVLVRPGMPCPAGSPADRVCECYRLLAREAARRRAPLDCKEIQKGSRENQMVSHEETSILAKMTNRWSSATAKRFVDLLLPCAVAAFQARSRHAEALLSTLLSLSPPLVWPQYARCVETGLQSPTEVAAQRAASTSLLTRAIPILLSTSYASNSTKELLLDFVRNTLPSLVASANPSVLVDVGPVLRLLAVAVSYAKVQALARSPDELEGVATTYTALVVALFAAHADAEGAPFQPSEDMVRVFMQSLPSSVLSHVVHDVLREARSRDHGARMTGLVRITAVCAPAETWSFAQQYCLCILRDPAARDTEVRWAAFLLAACLSHLGNRGLVRRHADSIWRGVRLQLSFFTSRERREAAMMVMDALMTSLMRPRVETPLCIRRLRGGAGFEDASGEEPDDLGSSRDPLTSKCVYARDADVHVEWPTLADREYIATLFNDSLKDCMRLIEDVDGGRKLRVSAIGSVFAATESASPHLTEQFICDDGCDAESASSLGLPGGGAATTVCESAAAVTHAHLMEAALHWLRELLRVCEWMYVAPTAELDVLRDGKESGGIPWWSIGLRQAWCATGTALHPPSCEPAYTRTSIFETLMRHVCWPLLCHQVLTALRDCGVDLDGWMSSPFAVATSSSSSPTTPIGSVWVDESVIDTEAIMPLLRWLASSDASATRRQWIGSASPLSQVVYRLLGDQSSSARRRLPLACWAERSFRLQVEAVTPGALAVEQRTFSQTLSWLQLMSFSPLPSIQQRSSALVLSVQLLGALDIDSLRAFVGRQRAVAQDIIRQWQVHSTSLWSHDRAATDLAAPPAQKLVRGTPSEAKDVCKFASATGPMPDLNCVASAAAGAGLHQLQRSLDGTQMLLFNVLLRRSFVVDPSLFLLSLFFLVRIPDELRSPSATLVQSQLLHKLQSKRGIGEVIPLAPAVTEALVRQANALSATYPARAVLLMTYALGIYLPSPQGFASLRTVQALLHMSLNEHVSLRCVAAELLLAISVPLRLQEELWLVRSTGASTPPASFGYSPEAVRRELSSEEQLQHLDEVAKVQKSFHSMVKSCPRLPHYIGVVGTVFPASYVRVPRSGAVAAGLLPVTQDDLMAPDRSIVATPAFVNSLTGATTPKAEVCRRQWHRLFLSPLAEWEEELVGGAPRDEPTGGFPIITLTVESWLLRLLSLPIDIAEMHTHQPVASPETVVGIIAALSGSSTAVAAATSLLVYATAVLHAWQHHQQGPALRHAPPFLPPLRWGSDGSNAREEVPAAWSPSPDTLCHPQEEVCSYWGSIRQNRAAEEAAPSVCDTTAPSVEKECNGEAAEEDKTYVRFRSLAVIASAVLRLLRTVSMPSAMTSLSSSEDVSSGGSGNNEVALLRRRALDFFADLVVCVCSCASISHRVASWTMLITLTAANTFLTAEEVWAVTSHVVAELDPLDSPVRARRGAASGQEVADDTKQVHDSWSQQQLRLLFFLNALLNCAPTPILSFLQPRLVTLVELHDKLFFASRAEHVRQAAVHVIVKLMSVARMQSEVRLVFRQCRCNAGVLVRLLMHRVNRGVFHGKLLLSCSDACGVDGAPTGDEVPCDLTGHRSTSHSPVLLTPSSSSSLTTHDAALLTILANCFRGSLVDILEEYEADMVMLLCASLDLSFTEVQNLHDAAEGALETLVSLRMPKKLVHALLEHLCRIILGSVAYGVSRRAKIACTHALRCLILPNLHRIGKYAVMMQVAGASLAALAHSDGAVQAEGAQLMAVLTKVAAEVQTRAIVQALQEELRLLPRSAPQRGGEELGPGASSSNAAVVNSFRRVALVRGLGAVVLADPGKPPRYVPRLMEELSKYAQEGSTDCGREVKRTFQAWWQAHREGWALEYSHAFTAAQITAIFDSLHVSDYYA